MSDLRVASIAGADGTSPATLVKQSAAKAWASVDYTSGTPSAQKSFNISSLVDSGTGNTDHNLTNAMADANSATLSTGQRVGSGRTITGSYPTSVSAIKVLVFSEGAVAFADDDYALGAWGDLA